jgi:RNA polymerase sigma-70 factor (ECF subfamily)
LRKEQKTPTIEDLVQMSFIRAFLGLKNFRCESAFSTCLTRIAINTCITHHQTRRITLPESILDRAPHQVTSSISPEDEFHRKERWNTLLTEIADLPPRYRSVKWPHYVEDRPYPELVERLNIPIRTLKTRLFRGRKLVKQSGRT